VSGTSGASGYSGFSGASGKSGFSGLIGLRGPTGPGGGPAGPTGPTGPRGATGPRGPTGYGATGPRGPTGKSCIVEANDKIVRLACMEMPEVRFEDIIIVNWNGQYIHSQPIDPLFIAVCEPNSVIVISATPSHPTIIGARVIENNIIIQVNSPEYLQKVAIKLSGIRKGVIQRFQECSREQMNSNNRFWSQQFTS
jgi:hypothetical protein